MNISFVHGFMGGPSDWDQIREGLSGHETYAPRVLESENWHASLEHLRDLLPERSVLVGYSMGARLALGIAMEFPERCNGLVFLSGNPGLEDDNERQKRLQADLRIAERLENEPLDGFLTDWYDQPVFSSVRDSVKKDEHLRKLNAATTAHSTTREWSRIVRANSIANQPNYWPKLCELSMPLLLVAGENDEKYRKIVEQFAGRVSAAKPVVRILPRCGHIVHRECPDALIANLREFLETISHHERTSL